jgi:hypothetical protein
MKKKVQKFILKIKSDIKNRIYTAGKKMLRPVSQKLDQQSDMIRLVAKDNIRTRFMVKKAQSLPINVLFVCHEPSLWSMFESVYQAMATDAVFSPKIIALPYAHCTLPAGEYKDAGMAEFLEARGIPVIRGYDKATQKWKQPIELCPDYIFFQTPYTLFPQAWSVEHVAMIARVCYFSYGPAMSTGDLGACVQPESFFKYVSLFLSECAFKKELFAKKWGDKSWFNEERVVVTGYSKFDHYNITITDCNKLAWKRGVHQDVKRILWSTRWNTDEGMCHFFDYKDYFVKFCKEHERVDFVFRPHPLFWQNFEKTGEFPIEQQAQMKAEYKRSPNMAIDSNIGCEDTFKACDILVSDFSGMLIEFFPSGKPMIYTHRKNMFNEYAQKMADGVYWVEDENELNETLSMLLSGKDPLREKRKELMDLLFYMPECGAGDLIRQTIKGDYINC